MGAIVTVVVIVVLVGVVLALTGWDRYRPRRRAEHPMPTTEVFIDPTTHRRMRVWVDPASGAREYREELETTATPLPPPDPSLLPPPGQAPRERPPP